jgi:predicted CXXCH cytochrome family protein
MPSAKSKLWLLLGTTLLLAGLATVFWLRNRPTHSSSFSLAETNPTPNPRNEAAIFAQYAGSASCQDCHAEEFKQWHGSNHQRAERPINPAEDDAAFEPPRTLQRGAQRSLISVSNSVPQVQTLGLSGKSETHPLSRVIGNDPLRQFLVAGSGGRYQALDAAYDPHSNQWFNVFGTEDRHPGEWGHWTGRGMNWNYMCANCHNTRLQRNYDEPTDTYHTTMAEMSVGCEACHGPLKAHGEWQKQYGNTGKKDTTLVKQSKAQIVDTCGYCHARRTELTADFKPGENFFNHADLVTVDHSDAYYADGQIRGEDYEYASFLSSKMHDRGVNCLDCHNPHTSKTKLPGNWLCLRCHNGSDPTAPVINPVIHSRHLVHNFDTNGVALNLDLLAYRPSEKEKGGECVSCHMSQTTYMQRHGRHDHGFTIPDPLLTKQFGIPNACNRCHKDKDADWALKNCDAWYGEKMNRPTRERAKLFAQAQRGDTDVHSALLAWQAKETSPYWQAVTLGFLEPWAGSPDVAKAIIDRLGHTNELVRSVAARVLEPALQAEIPGAREALETRLKDPVRNVRIAAAFALRTSLDTNSPAGRELSDYLANNSDEPAGQLQKGIFEYSRNDLTSALAHFKKAADWDLSSAAIRQELAVVLSAMNRPQEAADVLKEACRLAPEDSESHYKLGLALNELGDAKGALAELQTVVRLEPRHARGWYNLALAQNAAGETDQALVSLARAEGVDSQDFRIPYARATILARLGREKEARLCAQRALEISPNNPEVKSLLESLSQSP